MQVVGLKHTTQAAAWKCGGVSAGKAITAVAAAATTTTTTTAATTTTASPVRETYGASGRWKPDASKFACQLSGTAAGANLNAHLTDVLERQGKLYESQHDSFKAKGYNGAVTILKKLDYRVHSISQLQGQRGFRKGGSILTDIEQILDTGTTEKLKEYLREPRNIASIALQKIHGVGPSIAKKLMDVGILNIADAREQVRLSAAGETPKYVFEARQLVGIKHYEAFQERIPREEVGRLAAYVREMVQKLVPGAQVLSVGSYRRGKQSSGDCDVLIAPPKGKHTINILWDLLQAMTHTGFLTDHLIGHDDEAHARSAQCTYMGVCKELGRNDAIFRRIDIKVYPRAALPFALLYFTGSDYFNRSMRNYCHSFSVDDGKHTLTLSDVGLFPCIRQRVKEKNKWVWKVSWKGACLPDIKSEQDVFTVLNLQYKQPHERDVYGAQVNDEKQALPVRFPNGSSCSEGDTGEADEEATQRDLRRIDSLLLFEQGALKGEEVEEEEDEEDGRADHLLVQLPAAVVKPGY
eukprot:GSChrysophyteH1.ASY1.ANO1.3184.1 assembled CDS